MKNTISGSFIATGNIPNACTAYKADPLSSLFSICSGAMQFNSRVFMYGDRLVRVNLNWIRDYMLTAKGLRYTEKELFSFPDLILDHQHESGFFYEIVAPVTGTDIHGGQYKAGDPPTYIVEEPYRLHEEGLKFGLVRLEIEADIEYLMVEGCYIIWQATGNDAWMKKQLPRLKKGLSYLTGHPKRWSGEYRMVKRAHTLDTWDFTDRKSSTFDRMIRPEDPMGIFHGDNTGLYHALTLMAKLCTYFGEEQTAARYLEEARQLKEQVMKHLWNGKFFRHFLMLDPADYGVDEAWQLSLSNAYALNRGILDLEQKRSVIGAYREMRRKYEGIFDDFRNLDPPYPRFGVFAAGEYVNGAAAPFVAGELALGAFEAGEEEYGADILDRLGCKFLQDGKIAFLYDSQHNDVGGGPRCWCGAEVMNAMTEGLAGVKDESRLFEEVVISPRFAAAGEDHAYVKLEYAASGAVTEYEWSSFREQSRVLFELKSRHRSCRVRMYAPRGKAPCRVLLNGKEHPFETERVSGSLYAVAADVKAHDTLEFEFK